MDTEFGLRGIVQGLTSIDGRECLVVQWSGDIRARSNGQTVITAISGYMAYDTATALALDGHVLVEMSAGGGGRLVMDTVLRTTLQ